MGDNVIACSLHTLTLAAITVACTHNPHFLIVYISLALIATDHTQVHMEGAARDLRTVVQKLNTERMRHSNDITAQQEVNNCDQINGY